MMTAVIEASREINYTPSCLIEWGKINSNIDMIGGDT